MIEKKNDPGSLDPEKGDGKTYAWNRLEPGAMNALGPHSIFFLPITEYAKAKIAH